jgi:hypothetical protein
MFMNEKQSQSLGADLMVIADQELEGLPQSGYGVFGPKQARLAAEDWVGELELMDTIAWTDSAPLGLAASAQLLRRLNANADRPPVASTDTKVSPIPSSNCFGPTGLA